MAYMAQLDDNNVVIRVLAVSDADCPNPFPSGEAQGAAFLESLGLGSNWKQTSFNANGNPAKRYNYAGIGHTYDADRDAFIPVKPFDSWLLDESTCQWIAPVPYPSDGGAYVWDEQSGDWLSADE